VPLTPANNNGLVHLSSPYSVAETTKRLETELTAKNVALFCHVDHSGEAHKVGLKMHPTQLLIFGNPKGGTPLMLAAPTVAIDLPLKALIWEDSGNQVWVTYNSPEYLQQRHNISPELLKNITILQDLLKAVVQE
jgi:uncharacterized protein (DUF302 family)